MLINIIKNSVESITGQGQITVTTLSRPLSVVIRDNGAGIDAESSRKLFTPFYSTKPDGQGLGLMFVKEVLTRHDCRFWLNSEGGTTTFSIIFPE